MLLNEYPMLFKEYTPKTYRQPAALLGPVADVI